MTNWAKGEAWKTVVCAWARGLHLAMCMVLLHVVFVTRLYFSLPLTIPCQGKEDLLLAVHVLSGHLPLGHMVCTLDVKLIELGVGGTGLSDSLRPVHGMWTMCCMLQYLATC